VTDIMLLIIGAFAALATAITIVKVRVPGGVNAAALGWMSEQWLAEQRVSRRS
jgi:hypothetical protein